MSDFEFHGVKALGYATELIFPHHDGIIEDKGTYLVIRTPNNPDFMWGNYLLFRGAPSLEAAESWPKLYRKHFGDKVWFTTLGWTEPTLDPATGAAFEAAGFALESADVFTTKLPVAPQRAAADLTYRRLRGDEWQLALRNHIRFLCHGEFAREQKLFEEDRFASFRRLEAKGVGAWYGAFHRETLVGDMGIFVEQGVARFQEVLTHFDYRRHGVCRSICHAASQLAAEEFGAKQFVTLASEPDAISAYRSIGFERIGTSLGMRWYDLTQNPRYALATESL